MLQGSMPAGLETCHGVVPAGGTLRVASLAPGAILLARQLVGITTIEKRVTNYTLVEQELSEQTMRRLVAAMGGGGGAVGDQEAAAAEAAAAEAAEAAARRAGVVAIVIDRWRVAAAPTACTGESDRGGGM